MKDFLKRLGVGAIVGAIAGYAGARASGGGYADAGKAAELGALQTALGAIADHPEASHPAIVVAAKAGAAA